MTTSTWRFRMAQFCALLLVLTLVVSNYVATPPTPARANGSPPAPTEPLYDVFVNTPHLGSVSSSAMAFTGRGGSEVTVSAGVLAVPLFAVGTDAKVPALSSIVVTGLGDVSVSGVRAALDGVDVPGNGCHGSTGTEKAAITGFYWDTTTSAWVELGGNVAPSSGCGGDFWNVTKSAEVAFDKVMFVVDLYCGDATCATRNGNPPGGTSMIIEVEGSGDGVFNSGVDDGGTPTRGDEAFEVVLGTDGIRHYPNGPTVNGIAPDRNEFLGTTISATAFVSTGAMVTVSATSHGVAVGDVLSRVPGCFGQLTVESVIDVGQFVMRANPADSCEFLEDEAAEIVNLRTFVGMESVPSCSDDNDAGPCLATVSAGWGLSLVDPGFGSLDLRPYKTVVTTSAQTLVVVPGDRVTFALRLPNGPFRSYDLGPTISAAMSIAASSSYIDSYVFTEGGSYSTVTFTMEARETTKVFTYGSYGPNSLTSPGQPAEIFFQDDCAGKIRVQNGDVTIPAFLNVSPDSCENQSDAKSVSAVMLTANPIGGDGGRAWIRADGHQFNTTESAKVTVCCVYGAFDGHQQIVEVGRPTGVSVGDWFAFNTTGSAFNDVSFTEPELRFGQVVVGNTLRVAVTSVAMSVQLSRLEFPDLDAALAGSFLSTNAQAFAFGDQMFAQTNPAFDFGLAGPSLRADGASRTTDGFFRACIPGDYAEEVWGLEVATAATRINGSQASSATNRNGGLVATQVSCGAAPGVLVSLSQFGYSAPYFAIKPAPVSDDPVITPPGGGGGSTTGGTLPGVPRSLAGPDRIATALAIVEEDFAPITQTSAQSSGVSAQSTRTAGAAVIVSSTSFADSLTAGPLAVAKVAPLFLTAGSSLDSRVASALTRFVSTAKTVYIVGGESAVSTSVANSIRALGYNVVRLAGPDRYATSVAVARDGVGATSTLVAATGLDFPDGLAAGVIAARLGGAIVLTRGTQVPAEVQVYVTSTAPTTFIAVGGPASTAFPNATRKLQGSDRYSTAAAAAVAYPPIGSLVGVASGEIFADGLASVPYLARRGSVLLLVRQTTVPAATNNFLINRPSVKTVQVFGGPSTVSEVTRQVLSTIVS